jgi:hypothetical protein
MSGLEIRPIGDGDRAAVEREARAAGAARIVLATTNEKLRVLAFYQRNGFVLAALHPGAVDRMRAIKPTIPEVADNSIPIRDPLDLEKRLPPRPHPAP